MAGWVKINDRAVIQAVQKAGLMTDGQVLRGGTYVPRWIADAAKLYKKGDGYADMSLEEFLLKVDPNHEGGKH